MIIQILLIASTILSINIWVLYGVHLHYQEKIEQTIKDIDKEYDEILDILDNDWAYKNEVQDKRLYKKHLLKPIGGEADTSNPMGFLFIGYARRV